ncbi:MAG: hypothetical protein CL889_03585 [Dehalococcoidia bacterium]|nr:hypothetical protein [Dehalococcoidia bacterium]
MWNLFGKGSVNSSSWNSSINSMGLAEAYIESQLETKNSGFAAAILRSDSNNGHTLKTLKNMKVIKELDASLFEDDLGSYWIFVRDVELKQNSSKIGLIIHELESSDLYHQLIGTVFPFDWFDSIRGKSIRLYWILQARINKFTPFVPVGSPEDKLRDQPLETRMEKAMRKYIPTEKNVSEWYPIWGMPELD